jgi:hypothetical protein
MGKPEILRDKPVPAVAYRVEVWIASNTFPKFRSFNKA